MWHNYKTILLAVLISDVSAVDVDVDVLCRYSIAICYCKRKSVPNTRDVDAVQDIIQRALKCNGYTL